MDQQGKEKQPDFMIEKLSPPQGLKCHKSQNLTGIQTGTTGAELENLEEKETANHCLSYLPCSLDEPH
jgi:hypothetical protein